jgi:hypothetical protein
MELDEIGARAGCRGVLGDAFPAFGAGDNVALSVSACGRNSSCLGDVNGIGNGETETAVIVAECAR